MKTVEQYGKDRNIAVPGNNIIDVSDLNPLPYVKFEKWFKPGTSLLSYSWHWNISICVFGQFCIDTGESGKILIPAK